MQSESGSLFYTDIRPRTSVASWGIWLLHLRILLQSHVAEAAPGP